MTGLLRILVLGAIFATVLGCGQPAAPKIDPVESQAKEEEINQGMQKAMEDQMKGKK